jgi:hypothetical protein
MARHRAFPVSVAVVSMRGLTWKQCRGRIALGFALAAGLAAASCGVETATCDDGTHDHDGDASTACAAWTSCVSGQYVAADGSATEDRRCAECTTGTFTTTENAATCGTWTACGPGQVEATPGSATSDRTCRPNSWLLQFGTVEDDVATAVSIDPGGNVFVAGRTGGALAGETNAGGEDAFVQMYDHLGRLRWTRQFGSNRDDEAFAVSADGDGVIVVGSVFGALPGQVHAGVHDAFVRRYDLDGNLVWTRQFGTLGFDVAFSVTHDAGNVVVAGTVGQTSQPYNQNAFVRVYDPSGALLWNHELGAFYSVTVNAVAVDGNGHIVVAGETGEALTDEPSPDGDLDGFVRSFDRLGNVLWTRQFGADDADWVGGVAVDEDGNIAVVGYTSAGNSGGDVYMRTFDAVGNPRWTRSLDSGTRDQGYAVDVDPTNGDFVVVGATAATLAGPENPGWYDVFVRSYDHLGDVTSTRQFGTMLQPDVGRAVSIDVDGAVVIAGYTGGELPGQESLRGWDAFVTRLAPL